MTGGNDDHDWQRIRRQCQPDARQQRSADAELSAGPDEPLDPIWVERAIARAIASGQRSRRRRTWIAIAATMLLLLLPSAWMTRRVLWPEGQNSHLTMLLVDAHGLLDRAQENENKRMSALAVMCDRLTSGMTTLQNLAASTDVADEAVAARSAAILRTADQVLDGKLDPIATYADDSLAADAAILGGHGVSAPERMQALDRLERMLHAALNAVRLMPVSEAQPNLSRGRQIVLRHLHQLCGEASRQTNRHARE